ncbi:hypothetical protein ES703_93762 [subsurface metagenome]
MTLGVVKIGWDRDNRLLDRLSQVCLSRLPEILKYHSRDLGRRHLTAIHLNPGIAVICRNYLEGNPLALIGDL